MSEKYPPTLTSPHAPASPPLFGPATRSTGARPASPAANGSAFPSIAQPDLLALNSESEVAFLARLRVLGLRGIRTCTLTSNRRTMVSFRGPNLRVHRAFFFAPDRTLRAIVDFVNGPGRLRRLAHREILAFPVPHDVHTTPPRRERPHPDDASLVRRLEEMHTVLNVERFGGLLRPIAIRVSRRMKTRLGHYSPAIRIPGIVEVAAPEIAISRRHIKRHGWSDAFDTLLHEMVHQWQDENGLPLGHGPDFRQKAIAVGAIARAKRVRPGTAER